MSLQPVPTVAGLWRDPAWAPGLPGVYALVVGVSRYRHLDDGPDPAPETHGLGQLVSSAATAAALFDWLADGFRRRDLPVVWCRLLLAPGDAERAAFAAAGLSHWAEPTYATLHDAVRQWTGLVPVEPAAARASRSLFFFSGHGVQANWQPLLLPCDYLDPNAGLQPQFQNCLGARELFQWMCEHPAAEHLALLDACRNEFAPLASIGATAHGVFPAVAPGPRERLRADLLTATAPTRVAYQLPGRPLTVFGQALLEAVRGVGHPGATTLPFRDLVDYVEPRVNLLLHEAGTTVEQTVTPTSAGDTRMVVTELAAVATATAAVVGAGPPVRHFGRGGAAGQGPGTGGVDARRPVTSPVPRGPQAAALTRSLRAGAAASLRRRDERVELPRLRRDGALAHDLFGHEYTTALWQRGVQLHELLGGRRRDDELTLHGVARDAAGHLLHVDATLPPARGGLLLVFDDPVLVRRERLAIALPSDGHGRVPVRLTLLLGTPAPGRGGGPPQLQGLSARLGPAPDGAETHPAYAWLWSLSQRARLSSLRDAAAAVDPVRLRALLAGPRPVPTAALAGALLLARAGQAGRLGGDFDAALQRLDGLPDAALVQAARRVQALDGETAGTGGRADAPTQARKGTATQARTRDETDADLGAHATPASRPPSPSRSRSPTVRRAAAAKAPRSAAASGSTAAAASALDAAWRDLLAHGAPLFADAARLAQQLVRDPASPDPSLACDRSSAAASLAHALGRLFELTLPGGDFIVVPGLPRPFGGSEHGALDADAMRRVLRGARA